MSGRVPLRVGWLSGVSRPGSGALSPQQQAFLRRMPVPQGRLVGGNVPHAPGGPAFRDTSLPVASAVNLGRFLGASQPLRRPGVLRRWRELKASCERLLLITGSCGSQIAGALERRAPEGARLELLCLGPVDWRRVPLRRTDVVGAEDRLSARFVPRDTPRLPEVGHLDYLGSEAVLELARAWVAERLVEGDAHGRP